MQIRIYMKENEKMGWQMVLVNIYILMEQNILDFELTISRMAKEKKRGQTDQNILVNFRMA